MIWITDHTKGSNPLPGGVSGARGSEDPAPTGGPTGESFPATEPVEPVVRRLTIDELERTVRDVVGVTLSASDFAGLPEARPIEGFIHVASGQTVSTDHVRAYADLARPSSTALRSTRSRMTTVAASIRREPAATCSSRARANRSFDDRLAAMR